LNNGGCPITGFELYTDDASGGSVTTLVNTNAVNDATLNQFLIPNLDVTAGTYRVMVRAFNREGSCDSPYLSILNLGYPLPITTSVQLIARQETSLDLEMPQVDDHTYIISYDLQIDDG